MAVEPQKIMKDENGKRINLNDYLRGETVDSLQKKFGYKRRWSVYLALSYQVNSGKAKELRSFAINSIIANMAEFERLKPVIFAEFEQDTEKEKV
jgi:hypothetical protein